jgi:hypothetical protein
MRSLPGLLTASVLLVTRSLIAQGPPAAPATPCATVTDVTLVCGQEGPEDLYALADGRWVIAGAYTGTGGINIIRVRDRNSTRWYPSPAARQQYDAKNYPGCPGPPGGDARCAVYDSWSVAGAWQRQQPPSLCRRSRHT